MKSISLLGATGSIGIQTLDIVKDHKDSFQLVAFSAGKNIEKLVKLLRNLNLLSYQYNLRKMQLHCKKSFLKRILFLVHKA